MRRIKCKNSKTSAANTELLVLKNSKYPSVLYVVMYKNLTEFRFVDKCKIYKKLRDRNRS